MLDVQAIVPAIFDEEVQVGDQASAKEDLTVHVKLTRVSWWHKKAIGGVFTACGEAIPETHAMRGEVYEGDMCETCFTVFEIQLAARANQPDPRNDASAYRPMPRRPRAPKDGS